MFDCINWLMPKKKRNGYVLIVGHSANKQGARGVYPISDSEYNYNSHLAGLIKYHCGVYANPRPMPVHVLYRDKIGIGGAYNLAASLNPIAIVELHFNAFNGRASGCETLVCGVDDDFGIKEMEFATYMQAAMTDALGNKDRGIKQISKKRERGFYNLSRVKEIPSIIIEPFFGDNKRDAARAIDRMDDLVMAIGDTLIDYASPN